MEVNNKKSTLNKTNFLNFALIISIFLLLSFVFFDISKVEQRSFVFMLLFCLNILYGASSSRLKMSRFEKTADYGPAALFCAFSLCWWVALTNYLFIDSAPSRFTAFFLIYALIPTLGLSAEFILYFADKHPENRPPWFIVRPVQLVLMITFGAIFYFIVYGDWSFHIGSPFELLNKLMREP